MTQTTLFGGSGGPPRRPEGRVATCPRDGCDAQIVWQRVNGRNIPYDFDGREHFMYTCRSEESVSRRRRMGLEPGVFPVSPSRLEVFRRCPAKYKRRYLDHVAEERDARMILGGLAHARQAALLRGGVIPTVQELCEQERCAFPLELSDDWRYLCWVMDNTQWDLTDAAVEEEHKVTWKDGEMTIEFVVKIDYWRVVPGDVAGITDFKSSWDILSPRALAQDWQAKCYPWALWRRFPHFQALWFQLFSYRRQRTVRAEPEAGRDWFEPDELATFEEGLRAECSRLAREVEFRPNPFCRVCPAGAHEVAHVPVKFLEDGAPAFVEPETEEDARRLAEFAWAAYRIAAEAKSILRPWVGEHGAIGPLGFQEKRSRAVPGYVLIESDGPPTTQPGPLAVLDLLRSDDKWIDQVPRAFRIDGTWLRSILNSTRKHVRLAEALEPYLEDVIEHDYEWGNTDRVTAPPEEVGA